MTYRFSGLVAAGAIVAAGPALAQTEIKIGYALAPDSHYGVAAAKFEEVLLAETGDQFSFKHFPSSGLGGEREVIEGLQLGTIEATINSAVSSLFIINHTEIFMYGSTANSQKVCII